VLYKFGKEIDQLLCVHDGYSEGIGTRIQIKSMIVLDLGFQSCIETNHVLCHDQGFNNDVGREIQSIKVIQRRCR
jgi:hypothetical protein